MGCPVALNSAIVQCVSQSNTHTIQTDKYSSSGYLFSLCLNVGRYERERERQGKQTLINGGTKEGKRETDWDVGLIFYHFKPLRASSRSCGPQTT